MVWQARRAKKGDGSSRSTAVGTISAVRRRGSAPGGQALGHAQAGNKRWRGSARILSALSAIQQDSDPDWFQMDESDVPISLQEPLVESLDPSI